MSDSHAAYRPMLPPHPRPSADQQLIVAGGCFWCVDGVFRALEGVNEVVSGYIGGEAASANYHAVCRGDTGHAEAVCVRFDGHQLDASVLLQVFFYVAHDPTQLNRQGADRGRQYRSALFYRDESEHEYFRQVIDALNTSGDFAEPIATTLEPAGDFYRAEEYHQNYVACNPYQPYVRGVALPKLAALQRYAPADLLKPAFAAASVQ